MQLRKFACGMCLVLALTTQGSVAAEREMNVRQGPDTVFDVPVAEIFPALAEATATDRNGRVGNEFVFWGYRLTNGENVWLYACAPLEGVDCEERRHAVCDGDADILAERSDMGKAVNRRCTAIAVVGAGDRRPGCTDMAVDAELRVGLLSCQ